MPRLYPLVLASGLLLTACLHSQRAVLVLEDPLTSPTSGTGVAQKAGHGEYSDKGWRATENGDFLMIELADAQGFEGALEVTIDELDWAAASTAAGRPKIHFLNMFSSPRGEHHVEEGGTNVDALWTLRTGTGPDGGPAYGSRFNVLWASRGAKRAEPSDYEETAAAMAPGWSWDGRTYTFRVSWSKKSNELIGTINGQEVFHEPWANQVTPLRYIYLARSPDFASFIGPWYRDLKVYRYEDDSPLAGQTPAISIVRPANGVIIEPGSEIRLGVNASDDGKITRVVYALNDQPVVEVTEAPFDAAIPAPEVGFYTLTATATDDQGLSSVARTRYLTVGQPWQPWGLTQTEEGAPATTE